MSGSDNTNTAWKSFYPFFVGGLASSSATCCIQPMDMVKVRMQFGNATTTNPITMGRQIIAEEGVGVLYKGLSAGLLRQMTYGMTRLGVFQTLEEKFKVDGVLSFQNRVGASLCAGGIGALVGTPADAALVRMQADTVLPVAERRGYTNALNALYRMATEEGIKGFFSGATPTIARGLAINVGMLTSYAPYKEGLTPITGDGVVTTTLAGALSGWTASTVSLPFDFIKTRLQKQTPNANGELPYKNFIDCARKVAQQEGIGAFYTGYVTFCCRITPHILLTWLFLDTLRGVEALK